MFKGSLYVGVYHVHLHNCIASAGIPNPRPAPPVLHPRQFYNPSLEMGVICIELLVWDLRFIW
ncbi:hypothetical protein C8T65DRAFT_745712 [Cerioporus squamosus]|nr:hypothetical protein C8T65DRAFT_745712 [Cerioporus squamosus]